GVSPFLSGPNRVPRIWLPAGIVVAAAFAFVAYAVAHAPRSIPPATGTVGSAGVFGSVADFGKALFTVQLLPFEVTALILMVAVIGVITLGGEQMREGTPRDEHKVERAMREAILREGKG
ncbi:MAG: NADH-quinone oxidoreductase subunit J, partial [Candidatus Eremiobacteraeota bacterium]|nr:NADH-quinone oxidoreductase subunit J [Candidatus Eremiobacteraeota bacterium]